MNDILSNMKSRCEVAKAKKVVWAIEELLDKVLKCYYKNKLLNFENERLSERYEFLIKKINEKYELLEVYRDLPDFDIESAIDSLKKFKEERKIEMEKIAIHENAYKKEKFVKCRRCDGKGGIDHFSHVRGGVCFACEGTLVVMSPGFKKHMKLIEKNVDDLPF